MNAVQTARNYISKNDYAAFKKIVGSLDFHEVADIIEDVSSEEKTKIFPLLSYSLQAKVIVMLPYRSKKIIIPSLSDYTLTRIMTLTDEDDDADLVAFLSLDRKNAILDHLRQQKRKKVEELLKYHPETAGGIMDLNFILVKPDYTVSDTADKIHRHVKKNHQSPFIVVTDEKGACIGYVAYRSLILAESHDIIRKLTEKLPLIPHTSKSRTILHLLTKRRSDSAGVVDEQDRILGIVHLSDLSKIVQIEATKSSFRFVGVSRDEYALDPVHTAVSKRYKWLIINLATAFLASFVVARFQDVITQMALLAAYLPIVAGMGGNAGMQSLVIATRGLALGEITADQAQPLIIKEMLSGVVNGSIIGLVAAVASILFHGNPLLGIVLLFSMIINLVIAGLFGALIPLVLKSIKIDPAVAGSIFLTTATDVFGFMIFLGLASYLLV